MKIQCNDCGKAYDIPDKRLKPGKIKKIPCPICNSQIEIDLTGDTPVIKTISAPNATKLKTTAPIAKENFLKGDELKKKILARPGVLPPLPQIMIKAREVMSSSHSGFKDLGKVLESDQAMAARILKLANSAYYGLSGKVNSIHQATVVLGQQTISQLITVVSSSKLFGNRLKGYRLEPKETWSHSLGVATCSKTIAQDKYPDLLNDAFSAGLIHDAGKLILDDYIYDRIEVIDDAMKSENITFDEAENKILGFNHADIAAELCLAWKIPEVQAIGIRYHHSPEQSGDSTLAYIIHLADIVSIKSGYTAGDDPAKYNVTSQILEYFDYSESDLIELQKKTEDAVNKLSEELNN